jgi:hypothetical protein
MSVNAKNEGSLTILEMREKLAREQGRDPTQPKYVEWFEGQHVAAPAVIRREIPQVVDIRSARDKQVQLTLDTMNIVGAQTYDIVAPRLPKASSLKKTLQAKVLPEFPKLGVCRIGSVILEQNGRDDYSAAEFYVTNFDAELSTTAQRFYTPKSDQLGGMFFGIGVIQDGAGNVRSFDRRLGRKGLYFQTKEITKAIYGIASISTGMTIEQLLEMEKNPAIRKMIQAAMATRNENKTDGRAAMIARV